MRVYLQLSQMFQTISKEGFNYRFFCFTDILKVEMINEPKIRRALKFNCLNVNIENFLLSELKSIPKQVLRHLEWPI